MDHKFSVKTIFYTISIIMIITWALSYFVYALSAPIHFLLLAAALMGIGGILEKE